VLDPTSSLPLYRQLARWLESRVMEGHLREGDRIESEPELAKQFQIGRPTVRQATDLLVRRGLLERRRGSGTYVRKPRAEVDLFGLGGTLASFRSGGVEVQTRSLGPARVVDGEVHVRRLHVYEGAPVVLEELALVAEHFGDLSGRDLGSLSLSDWARSELGLHLDHARQSFRVARAGERRATDLACGAGTSLLHVQRELFFRGVGRAVRANLFCRTHELLFSQTLHGETT
jgi:GntR family transcriptional regulator